MEYNEYEYELKEIQRILEKNENDLNTEDRLEYITKGSLSAFTGEFELLMFSVILGNIVDEGDKWSKIRALRLLAYFLGYFSNRMEMEKEDDLSGLEEEDE